MLLDTKKAIPIFKWLISGGLAVVVDISALYIFVAFFHIYYILAASFAFFISATTNYTISKFAIFHNAQNSTRRSYSTFMSISIIGLIAITLGMYILVEFFHVNYLLARFILAGTLGVASFFLHKYISFKDNSKF